jgi:hypothetical protein
MSCEKVEKFLKEGPSRDRNVDKNVENVLIVVEKSGWKKKEKSF